MTDELTEVFAALADPTRRAILARLSESDATVSELGAPFDLTLPTVSRHIAVLERAGLVRKARRGQERACSLDTARMRDAEDWIAEYRRFFEGRFDALERKFATTQTDSRKENKT